MNFEPDFIVIGGGFAGLTFANVAANKNKKVLIIERRNHIGGNSYDCYDSHGILVHLYGPHIFHTNHKEVFDYLSSFDEFIKYEHKVLGNIDGVLVPIPFNFTSLEKLLPTKASTLKEKLLSKYKKDSRVSIFDLLNDDDEMIKEFGNYVFEKVFAHYTAKQWGTTIDKVDTSVINRVPVVLGYNDLYFSDKYQFMPKKGFTNLFERMIDNENIKIMLSTDANELVSLKDGKILFEDKLFIGKVIYTGEIDALFNFKYGRLPYRSLNLKFEHINKTNFQTNSVVNYLTSEKFTRITEFKYLTGQSAEGKTTILKEYPLFSSDNNEAFYPIQNAINFEKYNKYISLANNYKNLYLLGRLAEYKYYNMDIVVKNALNLAADLTK